MADIYNLLSDKDLLDFSSHFTVRRPNFIGSTLFPDRKTANLKAEFYTTTDSIYIPEMAFVNSWDAEAKTGHRPTPSKVEFDKLLIKLKISQSERALNLQDNGVASEQELMRYIFNDAAKMAEGVVTRAEVAKMEVIQTGKMTIDENGVKAQIDFKVPKASKFSFDWTNDTHDVLSDILSVTDAADNNGRSINKCITSKKIVALLRKNKVIQQAINGTANEGVLVTLTQINNLLEQEYGFSIEVYSGKYQYQKADESIGIANLINENKIIFMSTAADGTMGAGLWGKTPDELASSTTWQNIPSGTTFDANSMFVTTKQWYTNDPVNKWTMSSGVFVPILPNPLSLYPTTITAPSLSTSTEVSTKPAPSKK